VVFTEAVYLAMNRAEVPAEEHGVHQLKGISTAIRLWRVPLRGDDAPYGGLGLSRAGRLSSTDPDELSKEREIVPQLLAHAEGLQRAMAPVAVRLAVQGALIWPQLRDLAARATGPLRGLWSRVPVSRKPAIATVLALLFISGIFLWGRSDAVERAVDRGDLHEASRLLQKLPAGPGKSYDQGRLDEARASYGSASAHYAEAARGGARSGFKRLVRMTRDDKCAARESAAKALGRLGDSSAQSPLERLAQGEFPDEGADSALGSLFGCSSRRAARDALERLAAGD